MKKFMTIVAAGVLLAGFGAMQAGAAETAGTAENTVKIMQNGLKDGTKNGLKDGMKSGLKDGAKSGL